MCVQNVLKNKTTAAKNNTNYNVTDILYRDFTIKQGRDVVYEIPFL